MPSEPAYVPPYYRHVALPRATRLLDPRGYRVDDLLRRTCPPDAEPPFFLFGERLRTAAPRRAWGFPAAGENGPTPFTLDVRVEGCAVLPQDAVCRPSHVTLNGCEPESGLQVSEDKFLSDDDVFVSALTLRNSGEYTLEVAVDIGYGARHARLGNETLPSHREVPPLDDLRLRLRPFAARTLVFAVAFASSPAEAKARAGRWAGAENPAREQADAYQRWFDENVPRFDCSDPWMIRLWYHHADLMRRLRRPWPAPTLAAPDARRVGLAAIHALGMAQFDDGDFDRPREDPAPDEAFLARWPSLIVADLLGLRLGEENVLAMRPLPATSGEGGWSCFCLENLPCGDRLLTLVWDDPAAPGDAYDDGDKGFTLYVDGRPFHHQADLSPFAIPLPD